MKPSNLKALIVSLSLCFAIASPAVAEDISTARLAVPSWPGLTSSDRTGLYFDVFDAAFAVSDIRLEHEFLPMNRSIDLVEKGEFDLTGSLPLDDRNFAAAPLFAVGLAAIYHSDTIPEWEGPESLDGLNLVGPPQTSEVFGLPINEVDSRQQGVELLLRRRADAYMDMTASLLMLRDQGVLPGEGDEVKSFDIDGAELSVAELSVREFYVLFADTDRGNELRKAYTLGMRTLAESGELDAIYSKYNQLTPNVLAE